MANRGHFDPREHSVYRCRAADETLLYIGCTTDLRVRLGQHARQKDWWSEVATVTAEVWSVGWDARMAEKSAIYSERPLYNHQFNRRGAATRDWSTARPRSSPLLAEFPVPFSQAPEQVAS